MTSGADTSSSTCISLLSLLWQSFKWVGCGGKTLSSATRLRSQYPSRVCHSSSQASCHTSCVRSLLVRNHRLVSIARRAFCPKLILLNGMDNEQEPTSPRAPFASYPPSPERLKSRAPEFYGFVAWSSTYFLFVIYVLWALLPDSWIKAAGVDWYPNRYVHYL